MRSRAAGRSRRGRRSPMPDFHLPLLEGSEFIATFHKTTMKGSHPSRSFSRRRKSERARSNGDEMDGSRGRSSFFLVHSSYPLNRGKTKHRCRENGVSKRSGNRGKLDVRKPQSKGETAFCACPLTFFSFSFFLQLQRTGVERERSVKMRWVCDRRDHILQSTHDLKEQNRRKNGK